MLFSGSFGELIVFSDVVKYLVFSNDFCSLDVAVTNKKKRIYFMKLLQSCRWTSLCIGSDIITKYIACRQLACIDLRLTICKVPSMLIGGGASKKFPITVHVQLNDKELLKMVETMVTWTEACRTCELALTSHTSCCARAASTISEITNKLPFKSIKFSDNKVQIMIYPKDQVSKLYLKKEIHVNEETEIISCLKGFRCSIIVQNSADISVTFPSYELFQDYVTLPGGIVTFRPTLEAALMLFQTPNVEIEKLAVAKVFKYSGSHFFLNSDTMTDTVCQILQLVKAEKDIKVRYETKTLTKFYNSLLFNNITWLTLNTPVTAALTPLLTELQLLSENILPNLQHLMVNIYKVAELEKVLILAPTLQSVMIVHGASELRFPVIQAIQQKLCSNLSYHEDRHVGGFAINVNECSISDYQTLRWFVAQDLAAFVVQSAAVSAATTTNITAITAATSDTHEISINTHTTNRTACTALLHHNSARIASKTLKIRLTEHGNQTPADTLQVVTFLRRFMGPDVEELILTGHHRFIAMPHQVTACILDDIAECVDAVTVVASYNGRRRWKQKMSVTTIAAAAAAVAASSAVLHSAGFSPYKHLKRIELDTHQMLPSSLFKRICCNRAGIDVVDGREWSLCLLPSSFLGVGFKQLHSLQLCDHLLRYMNDDSIVNALAKKSLHITCLTITGNCEDFHAMKRAQFTQGFVRFMSQLGKKITELSIERSKLITDQALLLLHLILRNSLTSLSINGCFNLTKIWMEEYTKCVNNIAKLSLKHAWRSYDVNVLRQYVHAQPNLTSLHVKLPNVYDGDLDDCKRTKFRLTGLQSKPQHKIKK